MEARSCRDVLFLLIFAAYLAGMFVVAGIAFQNGAVLGGVSGLCCEGLVVCRPRLRTAALCRFAGRPLSRRARR